MAHRNINPALIRGLNEEEQKKRGWGLVVDGKEINVVHWLKLYNNKIGVTLDYGMRAEGYDGIVIHELGGGGSVLVPYVIYDAPHLAFSNASLLWIGLLMQERKTQGGPVLNLPRGFFNPGETHFETAVREFSEETGHVAEENRIKDLCRGYGTRGNANSAFFDTSRYNEDGFPEGVQYFAVEFYPDEVHMQISHPDDPPVLAFRKDARIKPVQNDPIAERIFSCYFYPWDVAAGVADQFTNSGVSRLLSYLVRERRFSLMTKNSVVRLLF